MSEYAWPEVLRHTRLSFYLQHNTLRSVSPVTRATQVMRREAARWVSVSLMLWAPGFGTDQPGSATQSPAVSRSGWRAGVHRGA